MKWNRMSDKLPDREPNARYSQVACLVCKDREISILVFNHEHMVWDDSSGDDFECNIGDVQYWMPLPAMPTAENIESAPTCQTTAASVNAGK